MLCWSDVFFNCLKLAADMKYIMDMWKHIRATHTMNLSTHWHMKLWWVKSKTRCLTSVFGTCFKVTDLCVRTGSLCFWRPAVDLNTQALTMDALFGSVIRWDHTEMWSGVISSTRVWRIGALKLAHWHVWVSTCVPWARNRMRCPFRDLLGLMLCWKHSLLIVVLTLHFYKKQGVERPMFWAALTTSDLLRLLTMVQEAQRSGLHRGPWGAIACIYSVERTMLFFIRIQNASSCVLRWYVDLCCWCLRMLLIQATLHRWSRSGGTILLHVWQASGMLAELLLA